MIGERANHAESAGTRSRGRLSLHRVIGPCLKRRAHSRRYARISVQGGRGRRSCRSGHYAARTGLVAAGDDEDHTSVNGAADASVIMRFTTSVHGQGIWVAMRRTSSFKGECSYRTRSAVHRELGESREGIAVVSGAFGAARTRNADVFAWPAAQRIEPRKALAVLGGLLIAGGIRRGGERAARCRSRRHAGARTAAGLAADSSPDSGSFGSVSRPDAAASLSPASIWQRTWCVDDETCRRC